MRFGNSPYPQRQRRRPEALDYQQLGGGAQTRRPPSTPEAGSSETFNPQLPPAPDEEDNDPERTITNSEDGDDEYLPSEDDPKITQISLLMNFCQDEWGPWCLLPGPIHKGV